MSSCFSGLRNPLFVGSKDPCIDLVIDHKTDDDLNVTAVNITLQKSASSDEAHEFACL